MKNLLVAVDGSEDEHARGANVSVDLRGLPDRQVGLTQHDVAAYAAVEAQILGRAQFTVDENGWSDVRHAALPKGSVTSEYTITSLARVGPARLPESLCRTRESRVYPA